MAHNVVIREVGVPQRLFLSNGRWVTEFPDADKLTVRRAKSIARKHGAVAVIDYGLTIEQRFNYGPILGVREQRKHKATEYIYEPGDATRYVFVLTQADGHDFLATTHRKGSTMLLPSYWRDGIESGYIRDMMNLNDYDAKVVRDFLRRVAETP